MKETQRHKELHTIEDDIRKYHKCPLHKSRVNAVPGRGPCPAKLMLIGEAPGKEEDMRGLPFVGRSGAFLDKLLKTANLSREQIYITSSVKYRPPKNRIPHANELSVCKAAWLDRQISLIRPKLIVLLGKTAVKQVTGISGKIGLLQAGF
jgi:uracil-DNA glycosylase family 4